MPGRYSCNWPGCLKTFDTPFHLNAHKRTHTGQKPFHCTDCGKDFAQNSVLTRHKKCVHEKLRSFHCNDCGKSFAQNSDLKMHKQSVHAQSSQSYLSIGNQPDTSDFPSTQVERLVNSMDDRHIATCITQVPPPSWENPLIEGLITRDPRLGFGHIPPTQRGSQPSYSHLNTPPPSPIPPRPTSPTPEDYDDFDIAEFFPDLANPPSRPRPSTSGRSNPFIAPSPPQSSPPIQRAGWIPGGLAQYVSSNESPAQLSSSPSPMQNPRPQAGGPMRHRGQPPSIAPRHAAFRQRRPPRQLQQQQPAQQQAPQNPLYPSYSYSDNTIASVYDPVSGEWKSPYK
ncbi:hypothetical protein IDH36_17480 [Xenorhabdus griffiniae]|nr:hypothetical protein [Xenorhabdus griffiniae]